MLLHNINPWNPWSFEGLAVKVNVWDFFLTLGRFLPAIYCPWLSQVVQPAYSCWSSVSKNSTNLLWVAFYHSLQCFESAPRPDLQKHSIANRIHSSETGYLLQTSEPQLCSWGVGTMVAHFSSVLCVILCSVAFYNVHFWEFMAGT